MWLATFEHFVGLATKIVLGLAQCENTIKASRTGLTRDCSNASYIMCCVFLTIINREEFYEKVTPNLSPRLRFESPTKITQLFNIYFHFIL